MSLAWKSLDRPRSRSLGFLPLACCVLFLLGGLGPNGLMALLSVIVFAASVILLWRPGESPILLFTFVYPWLQASAAIFHANWLGIPLADYSQVGGDTELAALLTLIGLLCLAAGMRLGAGGWDWRMGEQTRAMALSHPLSDWFKLYFQYALASAAIMIGGSQIVPGLMQVLLGISALRWAFFYLLAYASFLRPAASRQFLYGAFAFELLTSIGGFFSDFKTVFFFLLMALLASQLRPTARASVGIAVVAAMALSLGVVWTAVKNEYRAYVSGGASAQIVAVDASAQWSKLAELVQRLDGAALATGAYQLIRRLSYTEFFGVVLERVPQMVPHEDGAIWLDALSRPFTPRMFFPWKTEIDDSMRTYIFTGGLTRPREGTSISLGYIAESYIDFGMFGMMACLALFGYALGRTYKILLSWRRSRGALGMALASAAIFGATFLEASITKTFGAFVASLLAAWLICRWGVPKWCPWVVDARA